MLALDAPTHIILIKRHIFLFHHLLHLMEAIFKILCVFNQSNTGFLLIFKFLRDLFSFKLMDVLFWLVLIIIHRLNLWTFSLFHNKVMNVSALYVKPMEECTIPAKNCKEILYNWLAFYYLNKLMEVFYYFC